MKRIYPLFLTAIVMLCTILACGDDDDGVMERPDNTSVNYQLTLSDWLLIYYDVEVTYQDVHGVEHTERVDNLNWQFKDKDQGELKNFYLKAVATSRGQFPTLSDSLKTMVFSCDYRAEYYSKKTSAKSIHQTPYRTTVKKENIETFVNSNPTIKLFECTYKNLSTLDE